MSDSTSPFPPSPDPEPSSGSAPGPPPNQSWGQAPPPPAGYGYGTAPAAGYGQPELPPEAYANWLYRVGSFIIDGLVNGIPASIGSSIISLSSTTTIDADGVVRTTGPSAGALIAGLILIAISIAIFVWNTCIRQGRTGQSVGKRVVGTRLVSATTLQPIGAALAFVRYLCHIIDALPCYLGYFWPIWDRKRQTFADKIMSTYVLMV
jgi:uncharacterized RDD family membrane protein YckC